MAGSDPLIQYILLVVPFYESMNANAKSVGITPSNNAMHWTLTKCGGPR